MSMDCDEFYDRDDILNVKSMIEDEKYDGTVVSLSTYFKSPKFKMIPSEDYFVPLIHEIKSVTKHSMICDYPFYVDPTRKVIGVDNFLVLEPHQILMHHMSFIRDNIREKIENSSARENFSEIDSYVDYFENWTPDQPVILPQGGREFSVEIVEDQFGILEE